jgi:hypothetical protein
VIGVKPLRTENASAGHYPDTMVDTLKVVELIEKDTRKFPDTHGWGHAEFT